MGRPQGPIDVDAAHPVTGEPVRFTIAFSGQDILDAVLDTLRRDGAAPPEYTIAGGRRRWPIPTPRPPCCSPAVGGRPGRINPRSRPRRAPRERPVRHRCVLDYVALIDSAFTPDAAALDFSTTPFCTDQGVCDARRPPRDERRDVPPIGDATCLAWHAAFAPGTAYLCDDPSHAIREDVEAPLMIRPGLLDENVAGHPISALASPSPAAAR